MAMARAFIGIGSNIDPERNVLAALHALGRRTRIVGLSMVYRSDALGRPEQPQYLNCVAEIETRAAPSELKHEILRPIEQELGRVRTGDKYAPRTIDLDLIAYDDLVLSTADMQLPDPQILERPFLAAGLGELAPDMVLPGVNLRIVDIAASLPRAGMETLEDYSHLLQGEVFQGLSRQ